jgi:hypothetical protein
MMGSRLEVFLWTSASPSNSNMDIARRTCFQAQAQDSRIRTTRGSDVASVAAPICPGAKPCFAMLHEFLYRLNYVLIHIGQQVTRSQSQYLSFGEYRTVGCDMALPLHIYHVVTGCNSDTPTCIIYKLSVVLSHSPIVHACSRIPQLMISV